MKKLEEGEAVTICPRCLSESYFYRNDNLKELEPEVEWEFCSYCDEMNKYLKEGFAKLHVEDQY